MYLCLATQSPEGPREHDSVYVLLVGSSSVLLVVGFGPSAGLMSVRITESLRTQQSLPSHSLAHSRSPTGRALPLRQTLSEPIRKGGFHPSLLGLIAHNWQLIAQWSRHGCRNLSLRFLSAGRRSGIRRKGGDQVSGIGDQRKHTGRSGEALRPQRTMPDAQVLPF